MRYVSQIMNCPMEKLSQYAHLNLGFQRAEREAALEAKRVAAELEAELELAAQMRMRMQMMYANSYANSYMANPWGSSNYIGMSTAAANHQANQYVSDGLANAKSYIM